MDQVMEKIDMPLKANEWTQRKVITYEYEYKLL
jgi:hypothetical protein